MAERVERAAPRISLNGLAEYLVATPSRRLAIIRNHKRPPLFIVARYAEAEDAIVEYLSAGDRDLNRIYRVQDTLVASMEKAKSDWDLQRLELCHGALDSFATALDVFDLPGAAVEPMADRSATVVLEGVELSIRPELRYLTPTKSGQRCGLVKLYFRKSDPLTKPMAQYIAASLYYWGKQELGEAELPNATRCLVYDIFAGIVYQGPLAYARRLADIRSACQEIALRWPSA